MAKKQDVEEVKVPEFKSSKEMLKRITDEKHNKNTLNNNSSSANKL